MILVGITGKAGSGKDTVGGILRDKHGFALTSLAYPIKKSIAEMLGVLYEQWEDRAWKEAELPIYGCSPRHLAQTLGTEWGRHCIRPEIWVDLCFARLRDESLKAAAITDVRFENEATAIRQAGGYMIHVHRAESIDGTALNSHVSEQGVAPALADFRVDNSGTVEDLNAQVDQVVVRIVEREDEKV